MTFLEYLYNLKKIQNNYIELFFWIIAKKYIGVKFLNI